MSVYMVHLMEKQRRQPELARRKCFECQDPGRRVLPRTQFLDNCVSRVLPDPKFVCLGLISEPEFRPSAESCVELRLCKGTHWYKFLFLTLKLDARAHCRQLNGREHRLLCRGKNDIYCLVDCNLPHTTLQGSSQLLHSQLHSTTFVIDKKDKEISPQSKIGSKTTEMDIKLSKKLNYIAQSPRMLMLVLYT